VTLLNPLGDERSVMRTSLLPGLLRAVARARRHGERDAALFAVGSLFLPSPDGEGLPEERLAFAAVVAGDRHPWLSKPAPVDVWDAKGIAQGFVRRLVRREAAVRVASADGPPVLHPRGAAWIEVEGHRVGCLGPLHPDAGDAFDLGEVPVVVIDLDLQAIGALGTPPVRYATLPRFPASARDLAVVVVDSVAAGDVERAVREAAGDLGDHVALFDRFVGGAVPPGHASLALHVVYRAPDRTLTDAEVDSRHGLVVEAVRKRFGATLRQ
ncbi:MAG TPA: hypothetical protein VKU41_15550, partial [Polyangiaceae bacterium]|nr:hypothetical protein [Polyangiaceae bacterium]